ncbi:site-specific integrase [Actinomadura meridiana]|uniref:Site-specific integrase n=1 Tax=Actinomadura meridiana TaxID=559626 RepID=A0ABP8C1L4_9ACTN
MASVLINGYKGSIYREGKGYTGVLDLGSKPDGSRNRPKRKGRTKAIVEEKLDALSKDLKSNVKATTRRTVLEVVIEYVNELERSGKAPSTIVTYRGWIKNHISAIGAIQIRELEAAHVSEWLVTRAVTLSSESLRKVHALLTNSINRAIVFDYVGRNVSLPVTRPKGTEDTLRESKSFSVEETNAILAACVSPFPAHRMCGYVALAITTGLRVDELHGLTWKWLDIDSAEPTVYIEKAARTDGKLKTKKSKRGLTLGGMAVSGLKIWRVIQKREFEAIGAEVTKDTPVFTLPNGSAYDTNTARTEFRALLKVADISDPDAWTLRETRTTFVSVMSHNGVAREVIADMAGHTLKTLERHYRKVLAPVHRQSADVIDRVFGKAA